ncbi:MAG TPA: ROK family protein [Ignavibacteriaceae bacterium]|nr:ROK family protein [Ignavibacteriaceae bacterium]
MKKSNKFAVGVDLGGTYIKFGLVSSDGKIVSKSFLESKAETGPDAVIKQIKKGVSAIVEQSNVKINGIGIGAPGVISIKKGTVENPPNLPGWGKVHLGKIIQKEFDIDTHVENDANAAAIGEMIFGAGKKLNSFVMITLGTGVGGGIIFDRKLFRGETGGAGEIGHLSIDFNGAKCNCGSVGCIEAYSGNNYIIHDVLKDYKSQKSSLVFKLIENNLDLLTPKVISQAAEQNDNYAINVISNLGTRIGYAMASVANLLDLTTIIVGGGVSGFGTRLLEAIENGMRERVLQSLKPRVKVISAKLSNDAGIQGASSLVFYKS